MSCVVGVVHEGKVWMGADSAGSNGEDIINLASNKVFFCGPFLVGVVGSIRMAQILQYRLKTIAFFPDVNDLLKCVSTSFAAALQQVLEDSGFEFNESNNQSELLIGYKGRLFRMASDFQVTERKENYEVIGCGSNYALGSLFEAGERGTPSLRVHNALVTSYHFSAHVRPPYFILSEDDLDKQACGQNPEK